MDPPTAAGGPRRGQSMMAGSLAASWRVTGSADVTVDDRYRGGRARGDSPRTNPTLAFCPREMQGAAGWPDRDEPGRARTVANRALERHVVQFSDVARASEQQAAAAHVTAAHEFGRKVQAGAERLAE